MHIPDPRCRFNPPARGLAGLFAAAGSLLDVCESVLEAIVERVELLGHAAIQRSPRTPRPAEKAPRSSPSQRRSRP